MIYLKNKVYGSQAACANKNLVFVFIACGTAWLFFSLVISRYDFSVVFLKSEDELLIEEIEKFDYNAKNQSCHMRLTAKRLNNLFNLLSQKEEIFERQLDQLEVLSFRFPSSSRKILRELYGYVKMDDPNDLKVNSKFLKMLFAKSLFYSFDRNREFALIEPPKRVSLSDSSPFKMLSL